MNLEGYTLTLRDLILRKEQKTERYTIMQFNRVRGNTPGYYFAIMIMAFDYHQKKKSVYSKLLQQFLKYQHCDTI